MQGPTENHQGEWAPWINIIIIIIIIIIIELLEDQRRELEEELTEKIKQLDQQNRELCKEKENIMVLNFLGRNAASQLVYSYVTITINKRMPERKRRKGRSKKDLVGGGRIFPCIMLLQSWST